MSTKHAAVAVIVAAGLTLYGCSNADTAPETQTETATATGERVEGQGRDQEQEQEQEQDAPAEEQGGGATEPGAGMDSAAGPEAGEQPEPIDMGQVEGSLRQDEVPVDGSTAAPDQSFGEGTRKVEADKANLTPVAVRAGSYDGYDRVVIEFTGTGTPGWDTALSEGQGISEGSGAMLVMVVKGTPGTNEWPEDLAPTGFFGESAGVVRDVYSAGAAEDFSQWTIELSEPREYSVKTLQNPTRLVVDFKN